MTATPENPLLASEGIPALDRVEAQHVEPGVRALVGQAFDALARLEQSLGADDPCSWETVVEPVEQLSDPLDVGWGTVTELLGVKNSPDLRAAHEAVQSEVVAFGTRLGQSAPLYAALERLHDSTAYADLDLGQRRIVDVMLRDARLSGVALEGAARERFGALKSELAERSTRFSNHVLDATKAWSMTLRERDEVAGLPDSVLALAAQGALDAGETGASSESGPWRFGLDGPSVVPFLQHSRRRDLRERLYRAYITRASDGDLDNQPLILEILRLRREQARLLGFDTYAELSLASKMAPDVATVDALLEELRAASWDAAQRDLAELQDLASASGAPEGAGILPWDQAFWAERLREQRFDYSEEALRPYFPLPRVLAGLFDVARELFGVEIRAADGEAPSYDPALRFFRVAAQGRDVASFYLDPYSRPGEKRGGAWMAECLGRSQLLAPAGADVRLPVAYLVCNQAPPVGDQPSLMNFGEVRTLFHEFGHGLQHMLTRVDHGLASGIRNVEWDAVELPSQFMENWCYETSVLARISAHVDTGESLPVDLADKLRAARSFRAGSDMLRQLYFAMLDLELHHRFDPDGGAASEGVLDVQRRIAARTTVVPPIPEDRFLCSFGHIFAGGYAAGYFSYKWAEVLSADAFGAFEEAGLGDPDALAATGRRFCDTVLALGGSRPAGEVFHAFRGRDPGTGALLRHAGLG